MKFLSGVLLGWCFCAGVLQADADKAPLEKWLKVQQGYRSVYAEFVQTRKLAALNKPLVNKGEMWAKRPDRFLWKIGDPTQVTVLRNADGYLYLDAEKKEAFKVGVDSKYARQFEMLTGDMGQNLVEFEKRFRIEKMQTIKSVCYVTLQPVNRRFRKRVPWMILAIDTRTHRTAGFDVHLQDKTVIETRFTRYRMNIPIDDAVFQADTTGYKVKKK